MNECSLCVYVCVPNLCTQNMYVGDQKAMEVREATSSSGAEMTRKALKGTQSNTQMSACE